MNAMKPLRHLLPVLLLLVPAAASAADPAKTLFGIELGARFAIPACVRGEDATTGRHCHDAASVAVMPWGAHRYQVFYPRDNAAKPAPWARGEMAVDVVDGVIEAIHVNTWGIQGQGTALEAMTEKYGPPARLRSEKIKAHRSRFPSKFAEWELGDFTVRLDGTTTTIDWGRITLESRRYRKMTTPFDGAR